MNLKYEVWLPLWQYPCCLLLEVVCVDFLLLCFLCKWLPPRFKIEKYYVADAGTQKKKRDRRHEIFKIHELLLHRCGVASNVDGLAQFG